MARNASPVLGDLRGRRAVITGGSDGIGLQIASRLAAAGAEIVLPVRNRGKGRAARDTILTRTPGADVAIRDLDLSSLDSVAAFGRDLSAEGAPVAILVNNAGVMTPPSRQTTADGHELQFGTNHLGHVALVAHLLPLLRAGSARVVSQVSIAARSGAVQWDDPDSKTSYDGGRAYSSSKIALGLFGLELDRRSRAGGWGVASLIAHPGVAPTSLLAARPELNRARNTPAIGVIRALSRAGILVGTPESAALPAVVAAASAEADGGQFWGPSGPLGLGGGPDRQELYRPLRSAADARRIWDLSTDMAQVVFPA